MLSQIWKVVSTVSSVYVVYNQLKNMQAIAKEAEAYGLVDLTGFTNPLQSLTQMPVSGPVVKPMQSSQVSQLTAGA